MLLALVKIYILKGLQFTVILVIACVLKKKKGYYYYGDRDENGEILAFF